MIVADLEAAMVERLRTDMPDFLVEPFPDVPSKFQMLHPKGAILVSYDHEQNTIPSGQQQGNLIEYEINIIVRNLRGPNGAYEAIARARQSITRDSYFRILGAYMLSAYFTNNEKDLWYYKMTIIIPNIMYLGE